MSRAMVWGEFQTLTLAMPGVLVEIDHMHDAYHVYTRVRLGQRVYGYATMVAVGMSDNVEYVREIVRDAAKELIHALLQMHIDRAKP